jgi:nucleotide-binding universal stress UspA family protein
MYRNILVAIDHSDAAKQALRHATELASALGARLTVVSVAPPVPPYAISAGVDVGGLEQDIRRTTERLVDETVGDLPLDLHAVGTVRSGHPGTEIVAQITDGDHDLVVLGSRGRGRVASGVLGSVVGDVHFATTIPMLVVHPLPE